MSCGVYPLAGYSVLVKILCYDLDTIEIMIRDIISLVGEDTSSCYFQIYTKFNSDELVESIPNLKCENLEIMQNKLNFW